VTEEAAALLDVRELSIAFPHRNGIALAADRVSFQLVAGQTLGLVGESGCGKSVTCRSIIGLVPSPGVIAGGAIFLEGRELTRMSEAAFRQIRGSEVAMIFQDPMSSLNPVLSVGDQISEVLRAKLGMNRQAAARRTIDLLDRVGIPAASRRVRDYPHQLSGGMRQRVMIALAISCQPKVLLADEPTTALDVTIQDQILSLLADLQEETGMAMIVVSHDLGVIADVCDEIAVIYAGRIVEGGQIDAVLDGPRHPYTQALMAAVPSIDPRARGATLAAIGGEPPDIGSLPRGCSFAPRCLFSRAGCETVSMLLDRVAPEHGSACPFV
jgi:peptide/nickel transport system ATP-binding protein